MYSYNWTFVIFKKRALDIDYQSPHGTEDTAGAHLQAPYIFVDVEM